METSNQCVSNYLFEVCWDLQKKPHGLFDSSLLSEDQHYYVIVPLFPNKTEAVIHHDPLTPGVAVPAGEFDRSSVGSTQSRFTDPASPRPPSSSSLCSSSLVSDAESEEGESTATDGSNHSAVEELISDTESLDFSETEASALDGSCASYSSLDRFLEDDFLSELITSMRRDHAIDIYRGRSRRDPSLHILFVDIEGSRTRDRLAAWSADLLTGIDAPFSYTDQKLLDDAIVFGYAVALFLLRMVAFDGISLGPMSGLTRRIMAQFHEWQCGVGPVLLKKWNVDTTKLTTAFTMSSPVLARYFTTTQLQSAAVASAAAVTAARRQSKHGTTAPAGGVRRKKPRSSSGAGKDKYPYKTGFRDWLQYEREAKRRGVHSQFFIEWAAATSASLLVATTPGVAAQILEPLVGRRPDVILNATSSASVFGELAFEPSLAVMTWHPSALSLNYSDAADAAARKREHARGVLEQFVKRHFYGHYADIDLARTTFVFFSNLRGLLQRTVDGDAGPPQTTAAAAMNVFIESLARLNRSLKEQKSGNTVIAFVIGSPAGVDTLCPPVSKGLNEATMRAQAVVDDVRSTIDSIMTDVAEALLEAALRGPEALDALLADPERLLWQPRYAGEPSENELTLRKKINDMTRRADSPAIVTHNMLDENDAVLCQIRKAGLFNHRADRVKVVYHPMAPSAANTVLPLDYGEFVRACDLGVFAAASTPKTATHVAMATPAETTVFGTPTISVDMTHGTAAFEGRVVSHLRETPRAVDVISVERRFKNFNGAVEHVADIVGRFAALRIGERAMRRCQAFNLVSELGGGCGWDNAEITVA